MTIPGRGWWVTGPKEERLTIEKYRQRRIDITEWCEDQFGPSGERWIGPETGHSPQWRFKDTDDLFLFNLVWK